LLNFFLERELSEIRDRQIESERGSVASG
jgi:hypothetical protein